MEVHHPHNPTHKKKELLEVVSQDFLKDLEQLKYHENFTKEKLDFQ